jgi:hypothetical protein
VSKGHTSNSAAESDSNSRSSEAEFIPKMAKTQNIVAAFAFLG